MKDRYTTTQLSEPYQANIGEIVGRENEITKILAAWMWKRTSPPLAPLLVGDAGVGKNRIVYECARLCAKELFIYQGHEDVTAEDLICAARPSEEPGKKIDYKVLSLVTAMLHGGVCFVDEIAKIRPRALAPLASLLDERRYIDSTLLGERIYAHRGFRFVAATNTVDLDENPLPDFIRSRMQPVVAVDYPEPAEISKIIRSHFEVMRDDGDILLDRFWELWRRHNPDRPPTPRDSLHIFGFAFNLADFEALQGRQPYDLDNGHSSCPLINKDDLERAFEVFGKNSGSNRHVWPAHYDPASKQ